MLVGDVIQAIREATTDQPQTIVPPVLSSIAAATVAGGTVPLGAWYAVIAVVNQWGQTIASAEKTVTLTGGQNAIQLNYALPVGGEFINAYFGSSAGSESFYVQLPYTAATQTVSSFAAAVAAAPPGRNTAYNPDTDGDSFSAGTVFRWLNDALSIATQICGGLIDYCGVSTTMGNPMYVVPGKWYSIPTVWYDGYPLAPDKAGNIFRRNSITASVLSQVTTTLLTDRMMLEVWPQCARTAAATTLSGAMSATATSASLVNGSGFLLTNGMMKVDNEIMAYNGQFTNLIRGLGGTVAAAHAIAAPVSELNLFWNGWRTYQTQFTPGQSQNTALVPDEWKTMIPIYGLARVKLAEQDMSGYAALKRDFSDTLTAWFKANRVTTGPKQIGDVSNNLEVLPSLGGGWIVP